MSEASGEGREPIMKKKIIISTIVAHCICYFLGPPDMISQLVNGLTAALICAVPLQILARCGFVKASSRSVHTLLCVLVCMISVLSVACYILALSATSRAHEFADQPEVSSHP